MSDGTSEAKGKPKRAPRKRASVKSATQTAGANSSVSRKRATRKRAARKKAVEKTPIAAPKELTTKESPAADSVPTTSKRKAPTNFASDTKRRKAGRIRAIVVTVLLVIGIGSSAAVGFTDQGAIDVNQVITERNERVQSSGSGEAAIPQQNVNQQPDGGLIGYGVGTRPSEPAAEPVDTATSTATSSDEGSATSSEDTLPEPSVPLTASEANEAQTATSSNN